MNDNAEAVAEESDQPAAESTSEDCSSSSLAPDNSEVGNNNENGAAESELGSSGNGGPYNGATSGGSAQQQTNEDQDRDKKRKKLRRVMANRRSARESRDRRKKLLSDLQESVDKLTAENTELATANLALRQELAQQLQQAGLTTTSPDSILLNFALQSISQGMNAAVAGNLQPGSMVSGGGNLFEPPNKKRREN